MNPLRHAIVWINHREAKVCRFSGYDESAVKVSAHAALEPLHHRRGGWEAGGTPLDDSGFFRRVAAALEQTAQILIVGPGDTKTEFKTYMDGLLPHHSQVSVLEINDPPAEEAMLALGREHFHVSEMV